MRVAIVGINYRPELTGIGVYTSGLAEYLAEQGIQSDVYTAFPYYPAWKKTDRRVLWRRERIGAVSVRRHYVFVPSRPSALKRMLHELSFITSVCIGYLFGPRTDCTIIVSPPLFLGIPIALLARLKNSRTLFHVQDLQPDAAVDLGMLKRGWLTDLFYRLEKKTYRLVDRVGTISRGMAKRIAAKGVPWEKILLPRNWANDECIEVLPPETAYRKEWELEGKFVVLYAGNLGVKQGLDTLLDAAAQLSDRPDVAFVVVGDGGEKLQLMRRATELGLRNVRFEPLQPDERLSELLATADVSIIPQKEGVGDIVLPSKLGNILASARPVIVAADADTELAAMIQEAACGVLVEPGSATCMARAILDLQSREGQRKQMGASGRRYMQAKLSRDVILRQFVGELRGLVEPKPADAPLQGPVPALAGAYPAFVQTGGAMQAPLNPRHHFRIRTQAGVVIGNLIIPGRDQSEAERKLRQIYRGCEILEREHATAVDGEQPLEHADMPNAHPVVRVLRPKRAAGR